MRIHVSRNGDEIVLQQGMDSIVINDGWVDALIGALNTVSDNKNYMETYIPNVASGEAKLYKEGTDQVINPGDVVTTFRGEQVKFVRISREPEPGKTGKVIVAHDLSGESEYYAGVIGAEIR